jgi:glycosyltransferase involved in cell wall biosynthesis
LKSSWYYPLLIEFAQKGSRKKFLNSFVWDLSGVSKFIPKCKYCVLIMIISIIIPVYNVEKYLECCINSVINQSFKDLDIILVDDGSSDNSPIICDEFTRIDRRIKVIHKSNGGLSDARNAGLSIAIGEYVMFIDSDDYLTDENAISALVDVVTEYSSVEMILFDYVMFYETKKTCLINNKPLDLSRINGQNAEDVLDYLIRTGKFTISACTRMMKRTFLIENTINFEKGLLSEDLDWIFKIWSRAQNVFAINRDIYVYRKREGSITSTFGIKHAYDLLGVIKKWSSYYLKSGMAPHSINLFLGYCAYQLSILMGRLRELPKPERRTFYEQIKEQRWLFKYDVNYKTRQVNRLMSFFGFRITCFILSLYIAGRKYGFKYTV